MPTAEKARDAQRKLTVHHEKLGRIAARMAVRRAPSVKEQEATGIARAQQEAMLKLGD